MATAKVHRVTALSPTGQTHKDVAMPSVYMTIVLLTLAVVAQADFGQYEDKSLHERDLNGPVAKLVVSKAKLRQSFGEYIEEERLVKEEYLFDKAGRVLQHTTYHDKDLDLLSIKKGDVEYKVVYTYREDGAQIGKTRYRRDGEIVLRFSAEIGETGNIERTVVYQRDGSINSVYKYRYDSNGIRIEETYYSGGTGELLARQSFFHDSRGNLTQQIHFEPDGSEDFSFWYSYDDEGRKVEEHWTMGREPFRIMRYRYDERGNVVSKVVLMEDGTLHSESKSKYDEHGNRIEHFRFRGDDILSKETYTYEYDQRGNWITRRPAELVAKFGELIMEPKELTYREITYHE